MSNILKVEGKKTPLLDPRTNLGVILTASYQDREFEFSKLTGIVGQPNVMVLHFSRSDKQTIPKELNAILLMTAGRGQYSATGISRYGKGDEKSEFYNLGNDLELIVEPSADKPIRDIPNHIDYSKLI